MKARRHTSPFRPALAPALVAGAPMLLSALGFALSPAAAGRATAALAFAASALLGHKVAGLERRIRARTSELEESQRLARIGSFRWDATTDRNHWSDELYRIYGMTPGEVPPSFDQYMAKIHPDFRDDVARSVDEAIARGRPFERDYRIDHPSGEVRWVHAHGEILTDEHGKTIGLQGTCQDITDRKRAEEAVRATEERERRLAEESMREAYEHARNAADNLRALDEAKTVFLEAVSHELRTPLTVIVGISALMRDGDVGMSHEHFTELVRSLDKSALRLEHLLDDLLDLDRLGRGIVKPHRRPTAVAELAARAVGALDIGRHAVDVDAHEVIANVDPAQTERIVENLVANALKHTPPETSVWVRVESVPDGVVIVVEDSGPGVPDNIRETLFAPFVKDTRGHVPGTGIGLSLVLRFADLHGGRAWVEDRPGGGASFHVYLPSSEDAADVEAVA